MVSLDAKVHEGIDPTISPQSVDTLLSHSQQLWREPSYERLLQKFIEILNQHFCLERAGLFFLRSSQAKLNIQPSGIEFRAAHPMLNPSQLEKDLMTLNLRSPELRQGLSTFQSGDRSFSFAMLGDPAADWQVLVWAYATDRSAQTLPDSFVDFFVRQMQSASVWFQRLDKTQALLYRDDLTGVFNSRYLDIAIESEIRRSQRFQTSFSLLFVDLDDFKMVNDRFGHLNGSSVLRQLADVLRDGAREVDSVIRFGGDEFVVLLLGATANTGLLAGERIRRKIENARFFLDDGNHISLTASIGVAAYPEHAKTRETLLKIADEMMYYSKKQGKNRVSLYKTRADHEPQQAKKSL